MNVYRGPMIEKLTDGERHDAQHCVTRAIRALASVADNLAVAGEWTVLTQDLPHIEANIAHLRKLCEKAMKE